MKKILEESFIGQVDGVRYGDYDGNVILVSRAPEGGIQTWNGEVYDSQAFLFSNGSDRAILDSIRLPLPTKVRQQFYSGDGRDTWHSIAKKRYRVTLTVEELDADEVSTVAREFREEVQSRSEIRERGLAEFYSKFVAPRW